MIDIYRIMESDKSMKYCPAYNIGMCDVYSGRRAKCLYCDEAHVPCELNHLCMDKECKLGHSISVKKREMITVIFNKFKNDNIIEDCCKFHYNCISRECDMNHTIDDMNIRKTIFNIVRSNTDEDAEWYYDTYYINKYRVSSNTSLKTHSKPMFKKNDIELSEASTLSMDNNEGRSPIISYEKRGMKNVIDDDEAIVAISESANVLDMLSYVVPNMKQVEQVKVEDLEVIKIKKEELDMIKKELSIMLEQIEETQKTSMKVMKTLDVLLE